MYTVSTDIIQMVKRNWYFRKSYSNVLFRTDSFNFHNELPWKIAKNEQIYKCNEMEIRQPVDTKDSTEAKKQKLLIIPVYMVYAPCFSETL